jgi:hypothetical protein
MHPLLSDFLVPVCRHIDLLYYLVDCSYIMEYLRLLFCTLYVNYSLYSTVHNNLQLLIALNTQQNETVQKIIFNLSDMLFLVRVSSECFVYFRALLLGSQSLGRPIRVRV